MPSNSRRKVKSHVKYDKCFAFIYFECAVSSALDAAGTTLVFTSRGVGGGEWYINHLPAESVGQLIMLKLKLIYASQTSLWRGWRCCSNGSGSTVRHLRCHCHHSRCWCCLYSRCFRKCRIRPPAFCWRAAEGAAWSTSGRLWIQSVVQLIKKTIVLFKVTKVSKLSKV